MKESERRSEFNTPAEVLARAIFLVMHVGVAAGTVLSAAGLLALKPALLLAGLVALAVAWTARNWLKNRDAWDPSEQAIQAIVDATPPLDDARVNELIALLEEWEKLEQLRGSPEFDPWAVQAVRHDIRVVVERDPALEQLFATLRKVA